MRKNGNQKTILRLVGDHQPIKTKKLIFLTGLSPKQVYEAVAKLKAKGKIQRIRDGFVIPSPDYKHTPVNNMQAITALLKTGKYSLQEIAYELGISNSVVYSVLSELRNHGADVRKVYWLRE